MHQLHYGHGFPRASWVSLIIPIYSLLHTNTSIVPWQSWVTHSFVNVSLRKIVIVLKNANRCSGYSVYDLGDDSVGLAKAK